ncbi:TBC1 domain family member 1-like [Bolinopsis microptera]|uniref:TBC1 domain family member 1-like n=1 Tax=Bolinopsis microptera TaxID=2820187 RepID=UPI003078B1CC
MSGRSYEVDYFGNVLVNKFCSDAALHWAARDLACKVTARRINVAIHNCSINLLSETGLIKGIPFSFQSPYSFNAAPLDYSSSSLLYITELSLQSLKLICHVFLVNSHKQASTLKEDIGLLKEGSLHAKQRTLQRQVTETLERQASTAPPTTHVRLSRHRRSLSADRLPSNLKVPDDKFRRSSEDKKRGSEPDYAKLRQRRKSTPIKCREIYHVEYIGLIETESSQLPDIDKTVKEIQRNRQDQDLSSSIKGMLHIGYNEVQLLNMDHVTVIRTWPIKNVKACAQGSGDSCYIGWTCREVCGDYARICVHVFEAVSSDMGVTILHSIHKMCLNAYNQLKESDSDLSNKGLCKSCPIVLFNTICGRLVGLTPDEVVQELSNVIESLTNEDSLEVLQMFKPELSDVNAQNSLLVGCLRTIYERQQTNHSHTPGDTKQKEYTGEKRNRAVTIPVEPPLHQHVLMTAQDRRLGRRQKSSVRKAIYESVHSTGHSSRIEGIVSRHSVEEPHLSTIISDSTGFDVVTARDVTQLKHWETLLTRQEQSPNLDSCRRDIEAAVFAGVPDSVRGRVWQTLSQMRKCKDEPLSSSLHYSQLVEGAEPLIRDAVLLDIGRTFPTHAYYREELGQGQMSLCNVLLAYSTFDSAVGYCQGIGFLAGLILSYFKDEEEEAFILFKDLLTRYGLRDVYKPHMSGLKLRLYQLSRLVHDRHFSIHEHLNTHEVTPSLYAVSWIMTAFSAQLPFAICLRIMDFIFLQGIDALFKVILYTLDASEAEILSLKNFEVLMNYMKETIPQKIDASFEYRVKDIFSLDLTLELRELEIEYQVLHEDLESANKAELLETKYNLLKLQNKCHSNQITQLNRELERSRGERRALTGQVEELEVRFREETMVLNFTISNLQEEVMMLRKRNAMLRTVLTGEPPGDESEGEGVEGMTRVEGDDMSRVEGDGDDLSHVEGEGDDLSRHSDPLSVANIESLIADQFHEWNEIDDS